MELVVVQQKCPCEVWALDAHRRLHNYTVDIFPLSSQLGAQPGVMKVLRLLSLIKKHRSFQTMIASTCGQELLVNWSMYVFSGKASTSVFGKALVNLLPFNTSSL